ncbi:ribonuclease R [Mesorhizobium sp. M4B.F.Ca.ET.215.01.1.1]|uniref:Ribonuclease R n=4 Tax=Mesorhizobium TaxID=68287 RepID=A0ABU5AJA0_9HYPH|nr:MULTISPECIES: ribonuclease R [Mesorhizobium]MDX8537302.1 ribonuclease R [Mesorhizobium abyssinicae]RWF66495.1 MAG: ribonuclease R [Mesorhizobium sp.]TGQ08344.1 ribonuclease R [Mesorhizobium sp. M4B.F.Ca.ET.215.01.1.1]TGQ33802.1 ribonuclease R [Mesorhizobium sp. M4B.F.Ca.ET.214.01.1.1]TGQ41080.1 ribonuclease R [Mesorhizobium sp. M00.F.Ca.ET.220.01.1.1]
MARRISGRSHGDPRTADTRAKVRDDYRPSREEILRYIAENPDRSGKREIAKAFALRGDDRIWLKDLLRDLQDEGLLTRERKRLTRAGALPHVAVLDIFGRDGDGVLLAHPSEYSGAGSPPVVSIRISRGSNGPAPGIGDRVLAKTFPTDDPAGPAYTGRVMKIFEKRSDAVLGVFRVLKDGTLRIEPVERRQPELIVDKEFQNGARNGDLVEVEPARASRYGLPRAKVLAVLGSLTSEKAVSMIAIHAHDIPHIFPADVIAEADAVKPAALAGREDWRELPLITIDPADAKDHDDAVFATPDTDEKNPGGVLVTVAIADVAAYVRYGTALDREALKRGNSVYFPDRVVPMLPERISNDLCSLREGQDRPALAVRMTFAADGRQLRHSFHRVMMKSAAKLAYPQAQAAIDGMPDDKTGPILDTVLKPLWDAYAVLKRGRDGRQPLELDLPERKILLKEDGTVDRVVVPERLDAHKLIEEFMIQANVAAAETLEAKRQALVYRIHDAPSLAKQESLREFLATLSLSLARGAQMRPAQFNGILERVRGADNEALVNEVVLRSQSQAEYSPKNIGHFGLNLKRYAHFTSPIRRYADLIVHRGLIAALGLGPGGLTQQEADRLEEVSALISATERRAMAAERDTVDRLVAAHLAEHIDDRFDARISGVTKAGLFVQLPQYGADGFIPVSSLEGDYYIYDETARSLFGERTGKGYQLADRVEVRLVEVAPMAGAMRFEMLTDPKPLPGSKRSFHKAKGRARASQSRPRGRRR